MADFHEYYSGSRAAPYLTIFIGGNHEASNHLFELYYGGWVAPNIYYLGAANVLQIGPLRIAGLTGIWKPYDYPKPHFERLPYSQSETGSIYHVRELDTRKLLSLRSQVDIGLSHDWPQGIEMLGDYKWLFKNKPHFRADSESGKLGSIAANQCLERLRPAYWFSAHMHTKYVAIVEHGDTEGTIHAAVQRIRGTHTAAGASGHHNNDGKGISPALNPSHLSRRSDQPQISAWQQFHVAAKEADAQERDEILQEQQARREETQRTGIRQTSQYTFNETFNQVGVGSGLERKIITTTTKQVNNRSASNSPEPIQNMDGCGFSRPNKRQRVSSPEGRNHDQSSAESVTGSAQLDGAGASVIVDRVNPRTTANPDAIDIDMSDDDDDDDDDGTAANGKTATPRAQPIAIINRGLLKPPQTSDTKPKEFSTSMSEESEDGGVKLNPAASSFTPSLEQPAHSEVSPASSSKSSRPDLNPKAKAFEPKESAITIDALQTADGSPVLPFGETPPHASDEQDNEVSEEMRAQLAALSSNFTQREEIAASSALPFPDGITNKTTHFLALGKCEQYQEFLQLMEIGSIAKPNESIVRPVKLSYDPEWLAIQRVFAPELSLGGHSSDKIPPHRGDTYYRDQIRKEQAWITENVVKPGLLQIPENFNLTSPVYDPSVNIGQNEMPREVTNPQTSAFCELIGIENKFDISEEERDFRIQQGPRPEPAAWITGRDHRRGHGGGGRGGFGHGQRGGRGGGRGRGGGGRGRGRGRW